jgi:hypothetical protein
MNKYGCLLHMPLSRVVLNQVVELVMAWGLAAVILVSGFTLWRDWRSASTTHAQVPADLQLEAGCEADK